MYPAHLILERYATSAVRHAEFGSSWESDIMLMVKQFMEVHYSLFQLITSKYYAMKKTMR